MHAGGAWICHEQDSRVVRPFALQSVDWNDNVAGQECPFIGRRCHKYRKSDPATSIGSCTVLYGRRPEPILICPTRLLERRQIFTDCLHLLTQHEPGNELHIINEYPVPGGSVDHILVSAEDGTAMDFAGIEIQTLDTIGTVWPERRGFCGSWEYRAVTGVRIWTRPSA